MNRTCPLCSSDNAAAPPTRYSREPWLIKVCGPCGFVYLENPPDYSELQTRWPWERTYAAESERRRLAEPWFQRFAIFTNRLWGRVFRRDKLTPLLRRYFAQGAVMDVGCGRGNSLRRLGELGFVPCGVEISKTLADEAAAWAVKSGGRVIAGNALESLDRFPDRSFTGAILISFLEHEYNPLRLLVELRRKLVESGSVIIKVPNFGCLNRWLRGAQWCGFRSPDHVNYFTPRALREMVGRAGFSVTRFSLRDRFPFSDNMWMVCRSV